MGTAEIAAEVGLSQSCVWIHSHSVEVAERVCAIPECGAKFTSKDPRKIYCCREHAKLGGFRNSKGIRKVRAKCSLPECTNMVWAIEGRKRYCSVNCTKRDYRRNRNGFYDRILGIGPTCSVPGCGHRLCIDEHHYVLDHSKLTLRHHSAVKNKSVKSGPTIFLCPTHHAMVHRGFAYVDSYGVYHDHSELIRSQLEAKRLTTSG